ncbi:MAG: Wzy polymerase domain-containing protein [Syntrophales bacterium]|nr:Wzy polymerase domain-containing protein [Syntrophales bacterium]
MPPFLFAIVKSPEKILFSLLLLVFVLVGHIYLPNIGGILAKQNELIIWFISGLIVFISSLKVLIKKSFRESPQNVYVFLFVACWLGSSLFSEAIYNQDLFLTQCFWLLGGVVLWISLLQFELAEKDELIFLSLIFISAVIESLIGIIQFFGLYKYIPVTPSPAEGIVGGVFQQKNLFASWIATGAVVSLYIITTPHFKNLTSSKKILFWIGVFTITHSLALAQSRAGLIGIVLAIGVVVLAKKTGLQNFRDKIIIWLIIFVLGLTSGFTLLKFQYKLSVEKFTEKQLSWFTDPNQTTYKERILMLKTSVDMFLEKPLTGQGFGNFPSLYAYYQAKNIKADDYWKSLGGSFTHHPHNEIALIVAESGILGLIGMAILLLGLVRFVPTMGIPNAFKYLAFLTPLLFHTLVEYPLHNSVLHWLSFILIFALATRHAVKETKINISPKLTITLSILFSCLFILFSVYWVKTYVAYNQFVIWFNEYSYGKNAKVQNLEPATKNFYLRPLAKPMLMFAKAEEAVKDVDKNKEFLNDFLNWSEMEKKRLPIPQVFQYEAYVFLNLGMHFKDISYFKEALKTANEGLELYNNDEFLKKLRKVIAVEAAKVIMNRLRYPQGKTFSNEP